MKTLKILTFPNPILSKVSTPVLAEDRDLLVWLVPEMQRLMVESHGIGLAAPQVGYNKRLFIMDTDSGSGVFINPVIVESSTEVQAFREGCLSFPKLFNETNRPNSITVKYEDMGGNEIDRVFTGLEAVCFCHELDHLDGVLFIDKAGPLRAKLIKKYFNR